MGAALIGVIGAILGALVTALLNFQIEANRRRNEARGAAQLIAGEIKTAAIRLGSYAKARRYGFDQISLEQSRMKSAALVAELSGVTLTNVIALIESWESKRAKNAGEPVSEEDAAVLEGDRKTLESFAASLKDGVPPPLLARVLPYVWGLGIIVAFAVVVILGIACVVPRAEMTDRSIASALAGEVQGETYVSCSHGADRWHCDVGYPRLSCEIATSPRRATVLVALPSKPLHEHKACGAGAQPPSVTYRVAEGPDGPVATLDPDEIAREEFRRAILLNVSDPSYLDQAVDDVLGDG